MAECARAYREEVTDAFVRQPTMEDIAKVSEVDSVSDGLFLVTKKQRRMVQRCPGPTSSQDEQTF